MIVPLSPTAQTLLASRPQTPRSALPVPLVTGFQPAGVTRSGEPGARSPAVPPSGSSQRRVSRLQTSGATQRPGLATQLLGLGIRKLSNTASQPSNPGSRPSPRKQVQRKVS